MATIPGPARTLLDFIASYEAPHGYDTVYGNRMSRMQKPITAMTVDQVIANGPWRTNNLGSSACGRYQFMTATLKELKASERLTGRELMSPALQDRLGYALLLKRGYSAFMAGRKSITEFGLALAQEWASFPVLAPVRGAHRQLKRGQSYYTGDSQNHVLVGPDAVLAVLRRIQVVTPTTWASLSTSPDEVVELPVAETIPVEAIPVPWWQRLFGLHAKPKGARVENISRPGLHPNGDPALWDIQAALKARGYYTTGLLDGLNGTRTESAISQARKDNGMGDGGIDAEFRARLPSFPTRPVSKERAEMPLGEAARHAPELFRPPAWLVSAGLGSLGLGGASGAGLLDTIQTGAAKANDVFGQVQTVFGVVATALAFVVEHRTWFLVGVGLLLVWKGVSAILGAWIKIRTAFF